MTVIVGIPHNGVVHLGADSQVSLGWSKGSLTESKIWASGDCIFGFAGVWREAQILKYRVDIPKLPDPDDLMRWLVVDLVDMIRKSRKDSGFDEKLSDGPEQGPHLLIGVLGQLFQMDTSYSILEMPGGAAIGSGSDHAEGSLHTSAGIWKNPRRRIEAALQAACTHNMGCQAPFTFLSR